MICLFLNFEDALKRLNECVMADCWSIYITDEDRHPIECIVNEFPRNSSDMEGKNERTWDLIGPLLTRIRDNPGQVLNIAMNWHFFEIVVRYVPGTDFYTLTEAHHNDDSYSIFK